MVNIETRGGTTTGGQNIIMWVSLEDMEHFLEDVVKPNAAALGLKITWERTKEDITTLTQRPT
jgi:hypothetical protein